MFLALRGALRGPTMHQDPNAVILGMLRSATALSISLADAAYIKELTGIPWSAEFVFVPSHCKSIFSLSTFSWWVSGSNSQNLRNLCKRQRPVIVI
jgi:hypothetical protein